MLSVNAIIDGKFYGAGTPLPFTSENDLPEVLRSFIATGEEASTQPVVRNIYDLHPAARRAVRRLEMHAAHQEFAEQVAAEPLPPETAAALEASHELHIGRAKAEAEYRTTLVRWPL
jgi:hypothetical protein